MIITCPSSLKTILALGQSMEFIGVVIQIFFFHRVGAGFYDDGQSMIRIAPVMEVEADYNANRWFFVAESGAIEGGTQIVIKSVDDQ